MQNHQRLDIVEKMIWKMVGLPYRWGGATFDTGFDCSGGVLEILMSCGLWPNKTDGRAQDIYDHFMHPELGRPCPLDETVSLGTLCFYGASIKAITHIGMAVDDHISFEFGGGDHTTTTADVADKQHAFGRVRPIDHRKDLVAFVIPLELLP